jgi:hypothetical protein
MKKAYEYFASKHVKNQPSDRRHTQETTKSKEPQTTHRKELKDPSSHVSSVTISGTNSLKNSKNAKIS